MSGYFDYRLRFPASGIARAVAALTDLQSSGVLGDGDLPENMLGDPMDAKGARSAPTDAAFYGRRGRASFNYTDDDGKQQAAPAHGDPAYVYLHVRSFVSPKLLTVDLAAYGLEPVSAEVSADVLGVWA